MSNATMQQSPNGFALLLQRRKTTQETPVLVQFIPPAPTSAPKYIKTVSRNHRSFRLVLDLSQTLRAVKSALTLLDFEYIQLGDRRLMCLKRTSTNGERICIEFSFETLPSGLTEVNLFNCNRNLDSIRTELLRRQLNKLQQIIERAAA